MTIRNLPKANVTTKAGVRSDISPKALERWSPDVRAAVEDEPGTISILDVIGQDFWGDGVTARRISSALRAVGDREVTVTVNSPGGDFFEGLAIYNLLREHPHKVTINIVGIAASAASVIAMAGDEVRIARAGFLMIHNTWVMAVGDRNALRDVADWLEPFDAASVDIYAARTGVADTELAAMLDRETWIGGQSAVDRGFADGLLSSDEIETGPSSSYEMTVRAERKFDLLAARAGLSNSARREMLRDLKGGMRGAAPDGTPGAADAGHQLNELLAMMKSL